MQFLLLLACTKLVLQLSREENSCHVSFQQSFNDKVAIARCLVQYRQIFSLVSHILLLFISCKIWETQKIFPVLRLYEIKCTYWDNKCMLHDFVVFIPKYFKCIDGVSFCEVRLLCKQIRFLDHAFRIISRDFFTFCWDFL